MPEPRSLGPVIHITAEAIGQPGQRRFRIKAMLPDGTPLSLWLEKEQLTALGDAIQTVLKEEGYEHHTIPLDDAEPDPVYPLDAEIDFRIGQLSMGIDRDARQIVLIAAEAAGDGEATDGITLNFSYRGGFDLRMTINSVVAAGRAPCPLCSAPMDPQGHVCPRKNGHHPQS
ncbi:MAG: DUF3090 family protein [Dehalococcoidia bacterium]